MGNLTLVCRDAYLNHLKTGIKPDTLATLRTVPLQISTLFLDIVIKRAEDDIAHFENKGQSTSSRGKGQYHPYERTDKRSDNRSYKPAWPDQPRASSPINDNYSVKVLQTRLLAGSKPLTSEKTINFHIP